MSRVLKVDPEHPEREQLTAAVEVLHAGGLVAFPTETVYGLGANGLDSEAVQRIFAAKGRPATNPLILHVSSIEKARSLTREWSPIAERLAHHFWPGPLTLVVRRGPDVPPCVSAGMDTVAVRMPAHPVALALLDASGLVLAAPSANRYMEVSPTTAAHVEKSLGDRVDIIVDGGATRVGIESTVISIVDDEPRLLRPGMIGVEELEKIIADVVTASAMNIEDDEARPSPGLARRHYAPRARMVIVSGGVEALKGALARHGAAQRSGVIAFERALESSPFQATSTAMLPGDPQGYARGLYGALHAMDEAGVDIIFVEAPPQTSRWHAIWDRLQRAAEPENAP